MLINYQECFYCKKASQPLHVVMDITGVQMETQAAARTHTHTARYLFKYLCGNLASLT